MRSSLDTAEAPFHIKNFNAILKIYVFDGTDPIFFYFLTRFVNEAHILNMS